MSRAVPTTETIQQSVDDERAAIAREVHDEIGGALAALHFDLAWIGREAAEPAVRQRAAEAAELLQRTIGATQRIVRGLRPPMLDEGLVPALHGLAREFEQRTAIATRMQSDRESVEAGDAVLLAVYRTAQEALTNAAKHAGCSRVSIELAIAARTLSLTVSDDGHGVATDAQGRPDAFGLRGLTERAQAVGGRLDVGGADGGGTTVALRIPLDGPEPRA